MLLRTEHFFSWMMKPLGVRYLLLLATVLYIKYLMIRHIYVWAIWITEKIMGGNLAGILILLCINENNFRSILIKQCDPILKYKMINYYIRCMKRQYVLDVYCCVDVHFSNHSFDWMYNFHCTLLFTILFSKFLSHFANLI